MTRWATRTLFSVLLLLFVAAGATQAVTHSRVSGATITVAWPGEPPSLDPALATDTVSANILLNIMDPLVVLKGPNLVPTPNLAQSWKVARGGKVVTIRLRADGRWTDGRPVTAQDFEYSWKRTLDPALGSGYAYQMYGIKGALAYNSCNPKKQNCTKLRNAVGVKAVDVRTLRVTLAEPQPWFPQLLAHNIFLAVPRATVERFGENWTEPEHIVTNGAFRLVRWDHDAEVDLAKWTGWRNARTVSLDRVNGRMIAGPTAVLAFQAGELDALSSGMLSPETISRWKGRPAYYQSPSLSTFFLGLNVRNIVDPKQRRAMSLAIDRRTIVEHVTRAGEVPADGFTPKGIAGFGTIDPHSRWAPARGNADAAKALMAKVQQPAQDVTLYIPNFPGTQETAIAIQSMWQRIGLHVMIKQVEFKQFLGLLGPPPAAGVDAYLLGWIYDYPDAMNGLEVWTCSSGNNGTSWCSRPFDRLVATARRVQDNAKRYRLYGQLERMLFGPAGAMPVIPLYWGVNTSLVSDRIRGSFRIDPQTFIHFDEIRVKS